MLGSLSLPSAFCLAYSIQCHTMLDEAGVSFVKAQTLVMNPHPPDLTSFSHHHTEGKGFNTQKGGHQMLTPSPPAAFCTQIWVSSQARDMLHLLPPSDKLFMAQLRLEAGQVGSRRNSNKSPSTQTPPPHPRR